MACVGEYSNSHQQEMAFENADLRLTGEKFNMCELGLEGTYDNVIICVFTITKEEIFQVYAHV
jgi:hypothetical protein